MALNLTPKQSLAIYYLVLTGKEPLQSQMQPELTPKERAQLSENGLIQIVKNPNGGKGSCIRLTDRAWGWAEENLTSPNVMSPVVKSQPAAEALQALLKNLAAYIHKSGVRLTDLVSVVKPVVTSITPINPEVSKGKTVKQPTLKAVRAAYLKLSDGKLNEPVRISLLATRVPHASPETFLKLLEQWNLKQHLFFARLDDPQSLTEDDHRYTIQHLNTEKHTVAFKS